MMQESQGWMTPVLGLTKYFLGDVVFTWSLSEEEEEEEVIYVEQTIHKKKKIEQKERIWRRWGSRRDTLKAT